MEETKMNLYEKMSAITDEIGAIPKNLTIGTGKWQYKAVAEGDVLKRVKEIEQKYKVWSFPASRKTLENQIPTSEEGKQTRTISLETTYRFVNLENPSECIDMVSYGDGCDSLDKAPGKAMTYSDKYALMKAYKIETGEDPDQSPSNDLEGHSLAAIKQRVERTLTQKINAGMDIKDILSSMGINQKEFDRMMSLYNSLWKFETELNKV